MTLDESLYLSYKLLTAFLACWENNEGLLGKFICNSAHVVLDFFFECVSPQTDFSFCHATESGFSEDHQAFAFQSRAELAQACRFICVWAFKPSRVDDKLAIFEWAIIADDYNFPIARLCGQCNNAKVVLRQFLHRFLLGSRWEFVQRDLVSLA